jgi:FAD/FMN-containing dehydrogenase
MSYRCPGWDPGFTPQDVAALTGVTAGPVLLAGSGELAAERGAWEGEPAIAVGAADAADVVAAVRFAAEFGLLLTVSSPGHDAGTPEEGGLLLTTTRMDAIHVDRARRSVLAGAGARWCTVVRRAAEIGFAPLVPACGRESIVGRSYGWTAGHVLAIEYTTPEGRLDHVTATSDPPLFRRLCGSDASDVALGVITAMEFALYR